MRRYFLFSLVDHPYYGKYIKKISINPLIDFCDNNESLNHEEFERQITRMFLDKPDKPKHWATIQDILMAANNEWIRAEMRIKKGSADLTSSEPHNNDGMTRQRK